MYNRTGLLALFGWARCHHLTSMLTLSELDRLTPAEFALAVQDAVEIEATTRTHAEISIRLFSATKPLMRSEGTQSFALRKREKELIRDLDSMRMDLRLKKQIEEDGSFLRSLNLPSPLQSIFKGRAESDDEEGDEEKGYESDGHQELRKESVEASPSVIRQELLRAPGISAVTLNLDLDELPVLDIARLHQELVPVPLREQQCFLFAIECPSTATGPDISRALKTLELLISVGKEVDTLSSFVSATDFRSDVIIALRAPGGTTLKRILRAIEDGDIRLSESTRHALAQDMANAVAHLHSLGIAHGFIRDTHVFLTLRAPSRATVLFWNDPHDGLPETDIRDLGLLFAALAGQEGGVLNHLAAEMTQDSELLRPSIVDVVNRLMTSGDKQNELRVLESTLSVDATAIYELRRDASPVRR